MGMVLLLIEPGMAGSDTITIRDCQRGSGVIGRFFEALCSSRATRLLMELDSEFLLVKMGER